MYSYDDRMRAVQLYLKLGKRTSPDISSVEVGGHARKRVVIGSHAEQQPRTADAKLYR